MIRFEVLMDKLENPRKCTVDPIKDHPAILIRRYGGPAPIAKIGADILLHIDGPDLPDLVREKKVSSIAVIDCIWKRVDFAMKKIEGPLPILTKIPDGFVTAYPRRNKQGLDPDGGLATIEAMFIAAAFCGSWDETLLDKYHFKNAFLETNAATWKKYNLGPHGV